MDVFTWEIWTALAVVWLAGWGIARLERALDRVQAGVRDLPWDRIDALDGVVQKLVTTCTKLEADVDRLPHTWEEMHNKVRRTEERTRGAVRRAMAELEENGLQSPELNGIAHDLRLGDGEGSEGGRVPSVPGGVGGVSPASPPAAEADWKTMTQRYKWGR